MVYRSFGWIQNPSDLAKLKKTVQVFDANSNQYAALRDSIVREQIIYFDDIRDSLQEKLNKGVTEFSYTELVGTARDKYGKSISSRQNQQANALLQITILPQSANTKGKRYTDDWTADGFLRWAVSWNFVETDRDSDMFKITKLGLLYSQTVDDSEEEKEFLQKALLQYPPATQVLSVLTGNPGHHTRFFIGDKLGFRGEKGFTSYNEDLMIDWIKSLTNPAERTKVKQNIEGTSDKYARMICGWLKKVGWVSQRQSSLTDNHGHTFTGFPEYSITAQGQHALQQAQGASRHTRVEKFIMWEFLATNADNRDYIRTRRAYILKFLLETQSFSVLMQKLRKKGFNDDAEIIKNDIQGLNCFGIRINLNHNRVELKDSINNFSIPNLTVTQALVDQARDKKKADFLRNTNLPAKYIELLDIAFDDKRNRDFEIITAELFRDAYGLRSIVLGGGRKPDGLVFTDRFGIIIDTKAYSKGYGKNIGQADEMIRYIEDNQRRDIGRNPIEWWNDFDSAIPEDQFYFMWVSGKFIGRFDEQVSYTASQTKTHGGGLNVEQLLLGADAVLKGKLDPNTLPNYMNNNEIQLVTI